jgi:hypothetical protein
MTPSVKEWLKRRNTIEPVFGYLKSDNRMSRNTLKGNEGDLINALLSGCRVKKTPGRFLFGPFFVHTILRMY